MPLHKPHIRLEKLVVLIGLFIVFAAVKVSAQAGSNTRASSVTSTHIKYRYKNISYITSDSSGTFFYYLNRGTCKAAFFYRVKFMSVANVLPEKRPHIGIASKVPLLQLHGNVSYTFDYRSQLDTPFAAKNLQQHNEQVYADATIKGRYPFRIIINSRQSNSPFFKNYSDVNIQFNHQAFQQNIKQQMIAGITKKLQLLDSIAKYEGLLKTAQSQYATTKDWVDDPARMQDIVQEKEQAYGLYLKQAALSAADSSSVGKNIAKQEDSLKALAAGNTKGSADSGYHKNWTKDSLMAMLQQPTTVEKKMQEEEKVLDSLASVIRQTQHHEDSVKSSMGLDIASQTNKIKSASSVQELEDIEKSAGTNTLSKSDKKLLAVTQFGVGRSSLNYSELTVNNISLTGVNIEYNPSFYAAFAAGTVDYLFRDFVLQPGALPSQKIVLGRFGWGNKEKQIFIFTAYNGTKNNFGGNTTDTSSLAPIINTIHIFGYSLEAKYKLAKNVNTSFEFAKSSSPYKTASDKTRSLSDAFSFSDRNNEAWSAKIDVVIPRTESAINLFYKNIGADFQSYSIYNTGNQQQAWGIKWHQYLFKDQLGFTMQVKKSSIDDPFIPTDYNSAIIFKSVQAVYRKKKWPVFSVGYMPTTQLIKNNNGYLYQSIYYALTASVFYNYTFLKLRMNSSLMYSRFYNKGTDSGFVLYNAQNILYSHGIDIGKWHSQSDVQYTQQPGLAYWTFQQRVDLQVSTCLTVGAGLKNNVIPVTNSVYWGGSAQADLRIKKLGGLRLQYDKGYLSNGFNALVPNNWGRAMWYTVF